jgi:ketosteroid isomerase-like protein
LHESTVVVLCHPKFTASEARRTLANHLTVAGEFDGDAKPVDCGGGDTAVMSTDEVMRWVAEYERAWRDGDLAAVERLFTEDARYRPSPYDESEIGHDAIKAFWLDDEGQTFTVDAEPVAVEGLNAVVRLEVRYGNPVRQEYRDLWLLRFSDDGRVEDFEEWAYWPGKPHAAADE